MSVRYTVSDTDALASVDQGDLTIAFAPAADSYAIEMGENFWIDGQNNFSFELQRTLEKMLEALKEANFPTGPLAVSFATTPALRANKGDITVGNAATAPAVSEDGIRIAYQLPITGAGPGSGGTSITGMGGSGSSLMRINNFHSKIVDQIRRDLFVPAVVPCCAPVF